jgi:hypothetical protein
MDAKDAVMWLDPADENRRTCELVLFMLMAFPSCEGRHASPWLPVPILP